MVKPPETHAHVAQLIARTRAGEPVAELTGFVEHVCPPPPPSEPDWLGKLFFGSFQAPTERVVCDDVTPHEDDPFEPHRLFWVRVRGTTLDRPVLPGRASVGLFAYGPGGYRYVSRHRAAVEALLDADGRAIDEYAPTALGRVLIDALASRGPHTHSLIDTPVGLAERCVARGYRLDEAELRRCRPHLTAPTITGNARLGWTLDVCTLYGWMHDKRTLCRLRYRIGYRPDDYRQHSTRFQIEEHVETFSDRFFSEVPLPGH